MYRRLVGEFAAGAKASLDLVKPATATAASGGPGSEDSEAHTTGMEEQAGVGSAGSYIRRTRRRAEVGRSPITVSQNQQLAKLPEQPQSGTHLQVRWEWEKCSERPGHKLM
jgi:hypothetical protein